MYQPAQRSSEHAIYTESLIETTTKIVAQRTQTHILWEIMVFFYRSRWQISLSLKNSRVKQRSLPSHRTHGIPTKYGEKSKCRKIHSEFTVRLQMPYGFNYFRTVEQFSIHVFVLLQEKKNAEFHAVISPKTNDGLININR